MNNLFIIILNMSLTGVFVITLIYLVRFALKKSPKIISYGLWGVAGFRLVVPFSAQSVLGWIPINIQAIPPDIAIQTLPQVVSLTEGTMTGSLFPTWSTIGLLIWLAGVVVMLLYGIVSYVFLGRKLKSATHAEANVYEAQMIKTPFVFGIFSPRIFLPDHLTIQERRYIILHEQTHIKRRDNVVKFAAYFILCIHWFNPLVWLAYVLMGMDMEMSCDERVLKELGSETRKEYSIALLSLASQRRVINRGLLAFGGGNIKARIRNVFSPKKQSRIISCVLMAAVVVLSLGVAINSIDADESNLRPEQYDANEMTGSSNSVFEHWQCCDDGF
ncbi:MAG: M56 family metallopeptidase [Oscillospiraceae bacterium]|nr:M56 family metallopeptidase [Oscillospiraceae bacterium]